MPQHQGFRVDEGAYHEFARALDPLGDEVRKAVEAHVGPHVSLTGDGFSAVGDESGFSGAYSARMRALRDRLDSLGGRWREVADAARRTAGNYDTVEADQRSVLDRISRDLG